MGKTPRTTVCLAGALAALNNVNNIRSTTQVTHRMYGKANNGKGGSLRFHASPAQNPEVDGRRKARKTYVGEKRVPLKAIHAGNSQSTMRSRSIQAKEGSTAC